MAESHEPSYYEIALTNRQVVVAFIILLVCLLSAFFSGVWIGREGTAARVASVAEGQILDTPPQKPEEGQNLEELAFFDDRNPDPTAGDATESPAPAVTPPADTTLVEDVTGDFEPEEEAEPAAAPAPADNDDATLTKAERRARRREAREAAEKRAAEEKAAAASQLAAKPAAKPARAEETPAAASTPTRTARASQPSVPKGSVVIQVFSSPDKAQADRIRSQLAGGGYTAYLSPVEKAGHTMYRVRLGPYGSRDDAQKVAEKVRKGYKLDTWVTE